MHHVTCCASIPAVIPIILDEVEAARKEKAAQSGDPDAKIRALKAQFERERQKEAG
jgi:hypothetical protein